MAKVIKIVGENKFSTSKFIDLVALSYRSKIPRFSHTLTEFGNPPVLKEKKDSVSLIIPETIEKYKLESAHQKSCRITSTNPHLLMYLKREKTAALPFPFMEPDLEPNWEVDAATTMVLTLFRACAKKKELNIHLPEKFQLNEQEQRFIINLMQDNPYVTEFNINNNQSLGLVKEELLPVFARNRWLALNDYRPPLVDNYWQRAAKYWLIHLNEQPSLLADKLEHEDFKRCVREMGVKGLDSVLHLLRDDSQRELIEGIYAKNKPIFYAACQSFELTEYLDKLISHLHSKAYFPFSQLGLSYQPGKDNKYIDLINEINKLEQFEEVTLTDCLKNTASLKDFLFQLTEKAHSQKWTGLIVIPELENQNNIGDKYREIRSIYAHLNNVILHNRHLQASANLVEKIKAVTDFSEASIGNPNLPVAPIGDDAHGFAIDEAFVAFTSGKVQGPWPIKRGGVVQLQLQQQQEIQQSRQIQQEQQKTQMNVLEEIIAGERVTYENIDALLGKYYKNFKAENVVNHQSAALATDEESLLQGFFHTWINANPDVEARHVIRSMTLDAAKMLLRKHERFSSGLSLENLPKGFYTQRSKDGSLILCYNAEVGYINGSNPFTVELTVNTPKSEAWEGDFRQFSIEKYLNNFPPLQAVDIQSLLLFAKLQPPKEYQAEFDAFCNANPKVAEKIDEMDKEKAGFFGGFMGNAKKEAQERVLNHWLVFLQAWQYEGMAGVEKFLELKEADLSLDLQQAYAILFVNQSPQIKEWVATTELSERHLRAIGQVYYRFGDNAVALLLAKFRQIDTVLGREFFETFNENVLSHSENYCCFMTERFFIAIDDMILKLQPLKAIANRQAWLTVSEKHLQTVPWENIETLWKAFDYFIAEITELGLELKGDEFDDVAAENMLVAMDRILETLKRIPNQDEKVHFLRRLPQLELTHGGVHYAIVHEGFKYFDDELRLHNFSHGTPTYGPNLAELYEWGADETILNIQRTLASRSKFSHDDYKNLSAQLATGDKQSKDTLIWLMYTQYDSRVVNATLNEVNQLNDDYRSLIARHLHHAVFVKGNQTINIAAGAMLQLGNQINNSDIYTARSRNLLLKFPQGTFLEATSILWQAERWADFDSLMSLFEAPIVADADYPDYLFQEGYKLATLFGINDPALLKNFYAVTTDLKPVVQNQLRLLINQIQSIDYEATDRAQLRDPHNWQDLLACINAMSADLANASTHRIHLIERFNERNINFKYSKSGEFRALKDTDADRPPELGFFVDHQARLWNFLVAHIAVPVHGDAKEDLQPLLRFFKKMQLNRTYLNEIEPLLATLEKTESGQFWTISYFYQMLKALQPEDSQVSFPIPLVAVMLKDSTLGAKPIDSVEKDFPQLLLAPIQSILKNTIFDRTEQSLLCELALKEFGWQKSSQLLGEIIALLSYEERALSRGWALRIFAGSKNINDLESRIEKTRWLLENTSSVDVVNMSWTKTTALWLKALAARESEEQLFTSIRSSLTAFPQKRALILHIIAWSSLHQGLRDTDTFEYELSTKAPKLVQRLGALSEEDLVILANCYPAQPSPSADDILRLLNKQRKEDIPLKTCVDDFLRHPHSEPRMDFKKVAKTREADLQRMFAETCITSGAEKISIPADKAVRLSVIFSDLKQLQDGTYFVQGTDKAIEDLSQDEIASAFDRLSRIAAIEPGNDVVRAQIWALMFEALGRTTRKYPHLAQQFALIANDVCVDSNTRVLQLATGEGKSHFVALRAAKHAGTGKIVDVCTAKRTLAERDLEDYQALFDYLGLSSSYIHPRSTRENYVNTQIHYSTTGDLSLFLDEQSFKGQPIEIPPQYRIALFDEFDFIRFEEGRKTEYNYARPTGRTPKQMTWFYQAVNQFYSDNKENILGDDAEITVDIIKALAEELTRMSGEDEEKINLVTGLLHDPLLLVRWLQSAHEAHELVLGISFTVREESIQVGDTTYPMKEIIPLSSDNQKMGGSTFSAGVQQLLAVRLNTEAKQQGAPQNHHIHPESNIISSQVAAQRMKELWSSWEGFSGTISASQAQTLHAEEGTQVLHVPTNQLDRRAWHRAAFYDKLDKRMDALVRQIRQCMESKQSILFSCKNDAQVTELQQQLKGRLTAAEYANFIFYTNEDELNASEVLSQKRQQEAWRGGKKQQAVGLVASGFGRGDNVGVEAVFLFNVNDVNDLLQKGGRTARNGEEGEVFQFYMNDELLEEQARLMEVLEKSKGVDLGQVKAVLATIKGSAGEKTFAKVMLLREYVFSLQNAANQGYHAGLAQYSSWAMGLISKFADPTTSSEFANRVTNSVKVLEKRWLDISSKSDTTPDEKVREIEAVMNDTGYALLQECVDAMKGALTEVVGLHLNPYPAITLKMVLEKKVPITKVTKDLSVICTKLAGLPIDKTAQVTMATLPALIGELAENEDVLHNFTSKMQDCNSRAGFVSLLELAIKQVRAPSDIVEELKQSVNKTVEPKNLLTKVKTKLSKSFMDGIANLLPEISEELITLLGEKNILSKSERIEAVMPLVTYLGTFSLVEQTQWAPEYLYNLDKLLHNTSTETLAKRFTGNPMSYRHSESLWKLASSFASSEDLSTTWELLQKAVGKDPEQRLRLFNKWEALARSLDKEQAATFLGNFSKVMAQFSEGKDWDTFGKLVDKTLTSWNKDGKNSNKIEILTLWQHLADNATNLSALNDTISAGLKLSGKNWFQLLSVYTTLPPKQQVDRQPIFKLVLDHVEPMKKTNSEKLAILQSLIEGYTAGAGTVSSNHVLALIDEAPEGRFVGEYLSYRVELSKPLEKEVSLSLQENLSREVMSLLKNQAFFTKLTVNERRTCMDGINYLITNSNATDSAALQLKVRAVLDNYNRFLTKLNREDALGITKTSFVSGAQWYLQFSKERDAARDRLHALVADATSPLSMETLVNELSTRAFSTDESIALLHLAKVERLLDKDFSDSCQHLANVKAFFEQATRLGGEDKARMQQALWQLAPNKLQATLAVLSEHGDEINANPQVLNAIIQYGQTPTVSASRLKLLSLALFKSAGTTSCSETKLAHIKLGVDRFVNAPTDGCLESLLDLQERDSTHAEELLFDNVASYLDHNVKDGERNQVKAVIDFFYEKAIKHQGRVDLMFDLKDERLAEMFDFTKQRQPLHNERVIWMHLLNHHAFVTGASHDKSHDSHKYQWDHDSNQKLLQMGFEHYVTRTAEILKPHARARTCVNRDLSVSQQTALLQLSDELSIIGKPHLDLSARHLPKQTTENVKTMEQSIGKLMGNYSSSWFKSKERKAQFSSLQENIKLLATGSGDALAGTSRYEQVFLAINKARLDAMDSDLNVNISRRSKMNHGGKSRYFNTLNQMQDMVTRQWVQDLNAVQSFQVYKQHSKDELFGLTDRLFKALLQNDNENYPHPGDDLKGKRKHNGLFSPTNKTREFQKSLRFELQIFTEDFNSDNITKPDMDKLLQRLRADKSKLPGHLATLVTEILNRGDALATYLDLEPKHGAKTVLQG